MGFLLAVVPYRWLALLFYVQRWWHYRRLVRLACHITGQPVGTFPKALLWGDALELAIYRSTITILDHYPLADAALVAQIEPLVNSHAPYPGLVRALAAIQP